MARRRKKSKAAAQAKSREERRIADDHRQVATSPAAECNTTECLFKRPGRARSRIRPTELSPSSAIISGRNEADSRAALALLDPQSGRQSRPETLA